MLHRSHAAGEVRRSYNGVAKQILPIRKPVEIRYFMKASRGRYMWRNGTDEILQLVPAETAMPLMVLAHISTELRATFGSSIAYPLNTKPLPASHLTCCQVYHLAIMHYVACH